MGEREFDPRMMRLPMEQQKIVRTIPVDSEEGRRIMTLASSGQPIFGGRPQVQYNGFAWYVTSYTWPDGDIELVRFDNPPEPAPPTT